MLRIENRFRRPMHHLFVWLLIGIPALSNGVQSDDAVRQNNTPEVSSTSQPLTSEGWLGVAMSWRHTCVITLCGAAECWGYDGWGQLGNGLPNEDSVLASPVVNGGGVLTMFSGYFHSCARKTNGTVWCWGRNDNGEVGDGTTTSRSVAVQVTDINGDSFVGTADLHGATSSYASKPDGSAWCWGANYHGQIGDTTTTNRLMPTQVVDLSEADGKMHDVVGIDNGYQSYEAGPGPNSDGGNGQTCARKTDGSLWCWGSNEFGQLGDGTTSESHVPVQVGLPAGEAAIDIQVGTNHACALTSDGATNTVFCWGSNENSQLGNDTGTCGKGKGSPCPSSVPLQVTGFPAEPTLLSVGNHHNCVLLSDSTAWCWGRNGWGEHCTGSEGDSQAPVQAGTFLAADVVASGRATFLLKFDGTIQACGQNVAGELGIGTAGGSHPSPLLVTNYSCGDGFCDESSCEDEFNCAADCSSPCVPAAEVCTDSVDNDCDGFFDCADADCASDPACQPPADCSSITNKGACNAEPTCRWDNRNKVCIPN